MAEGRIQKALSGFYYVDTGAEVLTCRARGKFRKEGLSPLVGDRVTVRELGNGEGFVESVLPRKNAFERPAVANIDQLVVIGSAAIPKTDPFLIDRIAAIAALKGCEVVVLLNKCDLDPAEELYRIYTAAGFPTLRISAETGEGLEELIPLITGKLSAFTGNSGVGKSSILNALDPAFQLKTGEISTALGRGRHTTRHVELFRLSCGAEIMDSPGFSSFETEELNLELKHRLPETFREFAPYLGECQFLDCSHTKEKGCAVREALEAGKLSASVRGTETSAGMAGKAKISTPHICAPFVRYASLTSGALFCVKMEGWKHSGSQSERCISRCVLIGPASPCGKRYAVVTYINQLK